MRDRHAWGRGSACRPASDRTRRGVPSASRSRPAPASLWGGSFERRAFADVDRSASSLPADGQQPGARGDHWNNRRPPSVKRMSGRIACGDPLLASRMPTGEEGRRGVRIDPGVLTARDASFIAPVLGSVLEDVDDGAADLRRRPQIAGVVAVGDRSPASTGQLVEASGHPHAEALHRAAQCDLIRGLDDEMDVIGLNRVVHDAHAQTLSRLAQGLADRRIQVEPAQIAGSAHHARRHVHGKSPVEDRPASVSHLRALALGLAPGTLPRSTPCFSEP